MFTLLLVIGASSTPLGAHEYWLSPIKYEIDVGEKLIVDIRNGEDFTGSGFPFIPAQVDTLFGVGDRGRIPFNSRMGDYPAIHKVMEQSGMFLVVFGSSERLLTYPARQKFEEFIEYHGLERELAELGLDEFPQAEIKEHYYRFAKTLAVVKAVVKSKAAIAESDEAAKNEHILKPAGQDFEIVLLNNPYLEKSRLRVQLLYCGEPLVERQIEIFIKKEKVLRAITQTNESGIAVIDTSLSGEYMINAVQLLPPGRDGMHVQTLWTSLTFERR